MRRRVEPHAAAERLAEVLTLWETFVAEQQSTAPSDVGEARRHVEAWASDSAVARTLARELRDLTTALRKTDADDVADACDEVGAARSRSRVLRRGGRRT